MVKPTRTEIVKVQRALMSNDPEIMQQVLVYARGHRCIVQQKLDPTVDVAMGTDYKAFFEAHFSAGYWKIGKRVGHQDW